MRRKKSKRTGVTTNAIAVVYVLIGQLVEYAKNPRRNDAVVNRMVASIQEFGFAIPILATRDGTVIDGHLRLKAARKLGMRTVPVIWCDGWTEAQVKASG
jgi:ParB-like chromosome segregation protein Spo0J